MGALSTPSAPVRRALARGAAAALLVFLVTAEQVLTDGPFIRFDHRVMERLAHHHLVETLIYLRPVSGRFVPLARSVTVFGEVLFLVAVAAGVALVLAVHGRRRAGWFVLGAVLGGACVNVVVRVLVAHTRPEQPIPYMRFGGYGMPSGHAMDVTVCASAIVIAFWPAMSSAWARALAVLAASLVVLGVSLSRLVLLVHQVADVVGGVSLGLAWVLGLAALVAPWEDHGHADGRPHGRTGRATARAPGGDG